MTVSWTFRGGVFLGLLFAGAAIAQNASFYAASGSCEVIASSSKAVVQDIQLAVAEVGGQLTLVSDSAVSAKRNDTTLSGIVGPIRGGKASLKFTARDEPTSGTGLDIFFGAKIAKSFIAEVIQKMQSDGTCSVD